MRTSAAGLGACIIWASKEVQPCSLCPCHSNRSLLFVLENPQAAYALVLDEHLGLPPLAVRENVLVAAPAAPEDELEAADKLTRL